MTKDRSVEPRSRRTLRYGNTHDRKLPESRLTCHCWHEETHGPPAQRAKGRV